MNTLDKFRLEDRVIIITGGAGLLGTKHAEAVLDAGGSAVLLDISETALDRALNKLGSEYDSDKICGIAADITLRENVEKVCRDVLTKYKRIDGLINNAANNPKMEGNVANMGAIQVENFPLDLAAESRAQFISRTF